MQDPQALDPQALARENAVLKERLARLVSAVLRVVSTPDINAVLREMVDSTRSLCHARYGFIVTIDAEAKTLDFATSGLTAAEQRLVASWRDDPKLYEGLARLPDPLSLDDLPSPAREFGLSTDRLRSRTLLAVPLRHKGTPLGIFLLAERAGGLAFTDAHEELLVMYAALAGAAVANSHAHGNERAPEDLARERTEFLSLVSHGLRAPLSAIKGSAATVLDTDAGLDPVEMREFFRIIDEQANNMRSLIADLLDADRIETGTLSVSSEPTEVATLVDLARNTFAKAGRRHALRIGVPPDLPPVVADPQRIVQVLNNLLVNAARNAPETSPIHIDATHVDAVVAISVSDHGAGIPPDRLPHLFEKPWSGTGGRQGDGLGLAICKGLVEAHGGRIRAESAGIGQGSRLTFTLPVAARAGSASPAAPDHTGPKQRILFVDDDPQALVLVRNALTEAGYVPITAADPSQLPRLIRSKRPHLVLLDLLLPDADGIELMARVPELADLPVIFISGFGRDETIARALEAGAVDYIVKPFSPTELVARIRAVLRRNPELEAFQLHDLAIRYDERRVTLRGVPLALTATEYELLRVLSMNAGRVTTFEMLRRQVWGERDHATPALIRTFVMKLRHKLGDDPSDPAYIVSERGVGYRMLRPDTPLLR